MKTTMLMPVAASSFEAVRARSPYVGLAAAQAISAPTSAAHGTTASVAAFTTDADDVPGSPPREAPV